MCKYIKLLLLLLSFLLIENCTSRQSYVKNSTALNQSYQRQLERNATAKQANTPIELNKALNETEQTLSDTILVANESEIDRADCLKSRDGCLGQRKVLLFIISILIGVILVYASIRFAPLFVSRLLFSLRGGSS